MSNGFKSLGIPFFVGLTLSVTVGCQTGPKVETVVEETPGGMIVVQTVRTQATVVAIDAKARTVRLQPRRGDPKTFRVGEGAVNFQQVRVGDEVHAVVIHELVAPTPERKGAAVRLAHRWGSRSDRGSGLPQRQTALRYAKIVSRPIGRRNCHEEIRERTAVHEQSGRRG